MFNVTKLWRLFFAFSLESFRVAPWLLVTLAAAWIFRDKASGAFDFAQYAVALYPLSMFGLVAVLVHWHRKTLFHYVDLKKYFDKLDDHPQLCLGAIKYMLIYSFALMCLLVYVLQTGMVWR